MSIVTFIIFVSLADFFTIFPRDFTVSQGKWSEFSELPDLPTDASRIWRLGVSC